MKKLLLSFVAIASAVWFVGCSKSGGDSSGAYAVSCPAGSTYNGSYCVNSNGQIVNPTGPTTTVSYYDYNWYQVYTQYRGDMTIVNSGAYKAFLKEAMGICDTQVWSLINTGYANCDSWISGSLSIAWSMDSSLKPNISFTAYPTPQYFTASFGISGNGAALNPLNLYSATTYNLINNSKGFEIRSNGSSWNGGGLRLIQIQVPVGTVNDTYFSYDVYYPYNGVATKFASGKFKRY